MQSIEVAFSPEEFHELLEVIRPELHRYCARMMGSVTDGEDVVQDVLARAHASMSELGQVSQMRAWLFRVAHNRATDLSRAYGHRMSDALEVIEGRAEEHDPGMAADDRLMRRDRVHDAIRRFAELPPIQRSCVILKDVLEHSLEEIATFCEMSVPAVQAALSRGRAGLQRLVRERGNGGGGSREISPALRLYAERFGAHDWDGVRALLLEDVRLDVVSRMQRRGSAEVGSYFGNYAKLTGWRVAVGWLHGREAIGVFDGEESPRYFIEVLCAGLRVARIRDFRHVPYIAREASFEIA